MDTDILRSFTVQPSGNIGQEILGPDGNILAWTTDEWIAQVIVKLLNENEHLLFREGLEPLLMVPGYPPAPRKP